MRLKIDATKARAGTIQRARRADPGLPGRVTGLRRPDTSQGKKVYAFGPQYKVQPAPDFYAEVKMLLGESAVA